MNGNAVRQAYLLNRLTRECKRFVWQRSDFMGARTEAGLAVVILQVSEVLFELVDHACFQRAVRQMASCGLDGRYGLADLQCRHYTGLGNTCRFGFHVSLLLFSLFALRLLGIFPSDPPARFRSN